MKSRLTRIKTTYTDSGKYDQEEYFRESKRLYHKQIDYHSKVTAITESTFGLRPLEIGFLQSNALRDEPKFKEIKKIMTDYNRNVAQNQGKSINGEHLKTVVMDSMLKFMRLMLLAPDTSTKKMILDIAHYWFVKNLDPKAKNKSTNQLNKEIKQILVKKELLPIDIINKELILTEVQATMKPYRLKARTMYRQIDAPNLELQNYHTHKLEFLGGNPSETQGNEKKKWIDTVKFPKIEPPGYYFEAEIEQPYKMQEEPIEEQKKLITEQTSIPPPATEGQQGQPPNEGQVPPPNEEEKKEQDAQNNAVDLDFGAGGEAEEPEAEQVIEEDEDKKKGKLDPLLKVFLMERIRAKEKEEFRCDRRNQLRNNKINKTQIEDLNEIELMKNWASQKSRLKTEINKKHQSMKGMHEIPRGRGGDKLKYLENQMDKIKVQKSIEEYSKNIHKIEPPSEPLNAQIGTSLFDRRRVKTEASQKPFSAILEDKSRMNEKSLAVDEIQLLKDRLAKYRQYTPYDVIAKGLMHPLEKEQEVQGQQKEEKKVVWPNINMLSNPFFKVGKKKKKKKKKK